MVGFVQTTRRQFIIDMSSSCSHCFHDLKKKIPVPHQVWKFIIVFGFYGLCTAFYMWKEKWDPLECVYFITVTITTIGYGDVTPTSEESRVFTIFVILIGIFIITGYIADVVGNLIKDVFNWCLSMIYPKSSKDDCMEGPSHWKEKIFIISFLLLSIIFIGTVFLEARAHQSFVDSLYWSIVSITSVGYGDISLRSKDERIFVIIFIMMALFTLSAGVSMILDVLETEKTIKSQRKMLNMTLDLSKFDAVNVEGKGVDKLNFVLTILEELGVNDIRKKALPWMKKFEEFDQVA